MFRILKFLLIFAVIVACVSWLVNNNGEVVINWLGYEIVTDIFVIIALCALSLFLIFVLAYMLTKIFSFRFSFITDKLVDRSNAKKLKRMKKDSEVAYSYLTKVLALLDESEVKLAKKEYKKFCALTKNEDIIEYLDFRFKYFDSDFYKNSLQKVAGGAPGSSPDVAEGGDSYFSFASKKGWGK